MVMVEHIIERHIAAGYFARQPHGVVYPLETDQGSHNTDGLHGISVLIGHPDGLHARPATQFIHTARRLGVHPAYVVASDRHGSADSILFLLSLGAARGTHVTLVAHHGTEPDKLFELYR